MIIGVLSDTHSLLLPPKLLQGLKGVDLIIHAGDICDDSVLKALKAIAPVRAVQGNMDDTPLKKRLPLKDLFEAEGVNIGVFHGHVGGRDALANAREQFKADKPDIVIYGHSHQPLSEKIDGVLYFNPGSPNDAVRAPYFSYGLIEVRSKSIKYSIVKI